MSKVESFNLSAIVAGKKERSTKETKYVREGPSSCEITGIETSDSREDYSGAPYLQFNISTTSNELGRARFWAVRESDKPSTKEWKAKQLKEFLINCGVTDFSNDTDAIKQAVNKKVNITFVYEEYVGRIKDTDEPIVRKAIRYAWSSKDGEKIGYKDSYNKPLSIEDRKQFDVEHSEWKSNSGVEKTDTSGDDLPF